MKKIISILILFLIFADVLAQRKKKKNNLNPNTISYELPNIKWRSVGPYRGGRSATVSGSTSSKSTFYFGSTGGGVWKTTNSGVTWKNISDGYFGGSIGAVTVSESDPNIIYVGAGEKTVRGNVSPGYAGFWKSYDPGESWTKMNLDINQVQVGRIAGHPKNPDIVYVAIIGDLFKNSKDRGIYKSIDGGESWKKV